ncbi:MAG: ABC transporter permease subunit [Clostridia bacterium]|nr:ABC transporter permease subunit [Clostridia bacterium]
MKLKKTNKYLNIILPLAIILLFVGVWFLSYVVVGEEIIIPSPINVLKEIFLLFGRWYFWKCLAGTLLRALCAFCVSFVLAWGLVLIFKFCPNMRLCVRIFISICRALPTIAIILILLLWTTSNVASISVTIFVVLPVIFSSILDSLDKIDPQIIDMFRVFKISKKTQMQKYIIPQLIPSTIETIGRGFSLNLKLIVASEVLAGVAKSIGSMMSQSKIYFETAELFALVIITIILAVLIELVFSRFAQGVKENAFKKR